MKYMLLIYGDESAYATATPEDGAAMMAAYEAFTTEAESAGVLRGGDGLDPTPSATTVRVRNGERLLTDGPFAETREALGGYYTVECKDLDAAISWAAKIPGAANGSVEVRPVMNYEAVGAEAPGNDTAARA